jgi:uncharacterized membrane protein
MIVASSSWARAFFGEVVPARRKKCGHAKDVRRSNGWGNGAARAAWTVLAAAAAFLTADPAQADLRLCNMTSSQVGVSLGYHDASGWITEGWWNLSARACETLLKGPLASRFYYVYAVDYGRGGEWGGRSMMCTRDREFTIRGVEDCLARGFDRSGFFEVDTGEQKSWTIQLTDQNRPGG